MRAPKPPIEKPQPTETDVMLAEQRYDDYCKLSVAILKQLRSDPNKTLGAEQAAHLHHKVWIRYWYKADPDIQKVYRKKYPEMFKKAPEITIPWLE